MNTQLDSYQQTYETELTGNIIPFWEKNCPDKEYGAYFTCLDRDGSVYDTEKFMWMQWRIVWMFSELYHKLDRNENWIRLAENGYKFLTKHGVDDTGRYYFSLARDGRPAMAPYSVFSECFAVMGCAAYYRATGDEGAKKEAIRAFEGYLAREARPKGEWTKEMEGKPSFKGLGFYMMKANLYAVLEECFGDTSFRGDMASTFQMVLSEFWSPEHNVMFENVGLDGKFDLTSMAGRHLNPGHAIEAMWFVMHSAHKMGDVDTVNRAADVVLAELEFGWDKEHGGIFYFMDVLDKPHLELQWDMKLWWVHNEALIAAAMAYKLTGRQEFADWFVKIHDWTWARFPDKEYGEWYAYLNRQGEPTHRLKGGKWKTFFHLPRMLLVCAELLKPTQ